MKEPERLFMCRLALALGKDLTEIARMPNSEFITWRAYSLLEPFGSPVEDQRFDAFMKLFFSANAQQGTTVPDFFKRWELPKEEEEVTTETLNNKIKGYFAGFKEQQSKRKKKRAKSEPQAPLNNQQSGKE